MVFKCPNKVVELSMFMLTHVSLPSHQQMTYMSQSSVDLMYLLLNVLRKFGSDQAKRFNDPRCG